MSAIKFEAARLHFLSDVFAAVAVDVAYDPVWASRSALLPRRACTRTAIFC